MSNSLYDQYGAMPNKNIIEEFRRFRESMQGKNPQEEINRLLRSGKVSQNQLNHAQQMAPMIMQMFQGLFNGK